MTSGRTDPESAVSDCRVGGLGVSAVRDEQGLTGQPCCRDAAGSGLHGCRSDALSFVVRSYAKTSNGTKALMRFGIPRHEPRQVPAHLSISDGLLRRSYWRTDRTEQFQVRFPTQAHPLGTSD